MPVPQHIPTLAISMGDPAGIGAEVIVKALAGGSLQARCRAVIFGADSRLRAAAKAAGIFPFWSSNAGSAIELVDSEVVQSGGEVLHHEANSAACGELSFQWVMAGMEAVKRGRADALITAPISKKAWSLAGHGEFPGHTELLAKACGSERFAMFFHAPPTSAGPGMNVILATVHIPLMQVSRHLSTPHLIDIIELADETMKRLGIADPSIGVCGLNPHAGEDGILGSEDRDVIAPAVAACASRGLRVTGPLPADTIFQRALSTIKTRPLFDVVVAMYHDQGLIPLKTLAWDRAVNMTVGLPIIRTSPDHGTAFDIAGKNLADPGSMRAAIELAIQMVANKPAR